MAAWWSLALVREQGLPWFGAQAGVLWSLCFTLGAATCAFYSDGFIFT